MKSVIYIDRNNLYYYGGNVHSPVSFPLPSTAVVDMEVVNQQELSEKLQAWVKEHKIEPAPALLLLDHTTYFQKEIPLDTPVDKVGDIKKIFIENIPFNDTLVREYPTGKSTILVVINKDFIFALRDIFRENHFEIEAIAPVTQVYGLNQVTAFSATVAQDALKKITKESTFPIEQLDTSATSQSMDMLPKEHPNRRLFLMLGVFALLILILVLVLLLRGSSSSKKNTPSINPTAVPVLEPAPEATESAQIEYVTKEEVTIEVLNGSGRAGQADRIRSALEDRDFDNITTGNAPTRQSSSTLVIFKPVVSEEMRSSIVDILEELELEVSTQEKSDIDVDILITTAQ